MEHFEAYKAANESHPVIGKLFLLLMLGGLFVGMINNSDIAFGMSIFGSCLSSCYYVWRWRHEYMKANPKRKGKVK